MKIANNDIRKQAKISGVRLWQIADKLGLRDNYFSCKLRYELPKEEKEKIFRIIDELRGEENETIVN